MKWNGGACRVCRSLDAVIYREHKSGKHSVSIEGIDGYPVWSSKLVDTEEDAKRAAEDWVRTTIAQMGNALVQGHNHQDDGA